MNINKICKLCNFEKSDNEFNKSYNVCKACTKKEYLSKKIVERQPYRQKLKGSCNKEDVCEEDFNKFFIPFAKYKIMKKLPDLYLFCECDEVRKMDKKHFKADYDNKIFIDVVLCYDHKRNSAYIIHII